MANVLTTASTVTCGYDPAGLTHGGRVSTTSSAKLKVQGNSVLLKNGIERQSISALNACNNPENESQGLLKCSSVLSVLAGEATKLTVNGKPVMLDPLQGTTDGNPPGTLHADANQAKLTAI